VTDPISFSECILDRRVLSCLEREDRHQVLCFWAPRNTISVSAVLVENRDQIHLPEDEARPTKLTIRVSILIVESITRFMGHKVLFRKIV